MSRRRPKVVGEIVSYVQRELASAADPAKAPRMASYMKTDMPFYGAQKPARVPIVRALRTRDDLAIDSRSTYDAAVRALWELPHREEKYVAIDLAKIHASYVTPESMDLYEMMIRTGAWWDFVDDIAANLVGTVLLEHRTTTEPLLDQWIRDDNMWIRRAAILSQLRHKRRTDHAMLFRYCRRCEDETEFFIRKAIGWALREYSKVDPARVLDFLQQEKARLSGLSYREGSKVLKKQGLL